MIAEMKKIGFIAHRAFSLLIILSWSLMVANILAEIHRSTFTDFIVFKHVAHLNFGQKIYATITCM